ncbi:Protein GRINL1A-like [Tropilaelaps mercedesae]|uniref:Protein GRINL1A-like n=1 Tax=Tropilaelaps mercedesae TaxID=418985 RepID=A0A1V9X7X8_9ACAR|nr:Protein GRINL1A-like [Tropilaelaps mercedesae]
MASPRKVASSETATKFSQMREVELQETVDRQKKVLNNHALISKLKDKGEKIRHKLEAAQEELTRRNMLDNEVDALERLSLGAANRNTMDLNVKGRNNDNDKAGLTYAKKLADKIECCTNQTKLAREKFQPYRSLKHQAEIKPEHAAKWESFPDLKANLSTSKVPCYLSIEESMKLAEGNAYRLKKEVLEMAGVKMTLTSRKYNETQDCNSIEPECFESREKLPPNNNSTTVQTALRKPNEAMSGDSFSIIRNIQQQRGEGTLDSDDGNTDSDDDENYSRVSVLLGHLEELD